MVYLCAVGVNQVGKCYSHSRKSTRADSGWLSTEAAQVCRMCASRSTKHLCYLYTDTLLARHTEDKQQ